jgi:hypothetical protein
MFLHAQGLCEEFMVVLSQELPFLPSIKFITSIMQKNIIWKKFFNLLALLFHLMLNMVTC